MTNRPISRISAISSRKDNLAAECRSSPIGGRAAASFPFASDLNAGPRRRAASRGGLDGGPAAQIAETGRRGSHFSYYAVAASRYLRDPRRPADGPARLTRRTGGPG
jgi:hypothetical protein